MKHTAFAELSSQVKTDEGFRATPYKCTAGKLTVGYGLNLEAGITEPEAAYILEMRLNSIINDMERYDWYNNLGDARRVVIVNMVYQLGISRFLKFKKMIAALNSGSYGLAADEMMDSNWYKQTPNRAKRLIEKMREGVLYD